MTEMLMLSLLLPIFLLKREFKFLNKGKNHDINKKEEIKNFSHQQPF